MSKFTGKCDIYDWFGMIARNDDETPYECYKRLGSVLMLNDRPVKIEKPSDLVMFYPFVSASHAHSKDKDVHWLSTKGSYFADTVCYNPQGAARGLSKLMDEYWRVREEEDPKYGL